MNVIQLHDRYTEDIIGTILVTKENTYDKICSAWDEYQRVHGSNNEYYGDIYEFADYFPDMRMKIIKVDFYQPQIYVQ